LHRSRARSSYVGFLDNGGSFSPVNDPSSNGHTFALGINDPGLIVGYYENSSGTSATSIAHRGAGTQRANGHEFMRCFLQSLV
jgi:hypothetical protein